MPQEFAHTRSSSQKQDTDEQLNDVSMSAQAETWLLYTSPIPRD